MSTDDKKIMNVVDITCKEVTEIASDYLSRALDTEERARFEQHLHACTWCMTYLAQLRTTVGFVRLLGEPEVASAETRDKLSELFRRWKQDKP
jgi:anti-sigma factor RsiW